MTRLADRLRQLIEERGLTPRDLSRRAGLNATAVRDILVGKSIHPRHDTLEKLAGALDVDVTDLLDAAAQPGIETPAPPGWATAADDRAALERRRPRRGRPSDDDLVPLDDVRTDGLVGAKDLPVYASAEGGPSGMLVTWEPIEYVRRPEPLMRVAGGFGVYVVGDSMAPAYEHGDRILVHPSRFPRRGDDVFLVRQIDGHAAGLVKRLLSWTAEVWRLKQYNPPSEFELPRGEWAQALVIVGKYNRS